MHLVKDGFRFGRFELDVRAHELRKDGVRLRLQDQPFEVLAMLLEQPGEVLTRDELRLKAGLDQKYAELIYDALWSSPLRGALDAFNAKLAERLTGEVRVKLIRGRAVVTGSRSPFALYDEALATYGAGDTFRHDAAGGFIEIHGLPVAAGAAKAAEAAERATPEYA